MDDRNETAAVVRRFGGQTFFAHRLARIRGAKEHQSAVHRWIEQDRFPENRLPFILAMCQGDGLPITHPQLGALRLRLRRRMTA
jgi:hypothetical protein